MDQESKPAEEIVLDNPPSVGPFLEGEEIILIDPRGRRHLVELKAKVFHTSLGEIDLSALINKDEGSSVLSSKGHLYRAFRPTYDEAVLKMKRGAQVIYPKDAGRLAALLDPFPGARILEAGIGSGAFTMFLLKFPVLLTCYEVREDFARLAVENLRRHFRGRARFVLKIGDVYNRVEERELDRVLLDLPEPWKFLKANADSLRPGGLIVAYLPNTSQVITLSSELKKHGFVDLKFLEVLERHWVMDEKSSRPDHRMVAHTGFLIRARKA